MFLSFYTNILINLILNRYYNDFRCLLLITDDEINFSGNIPSVRLKLQSGVINYKLVFKYYGCQGIVIYSNHPEDVFKDFESQIRLHSERFNNRKYLLVPRSGTEEFEKVFFRLKELDFVSDILVLLSKNTTGKNIVFDLKTHKYVGLNNNNEPVFLDKWFSKNQSFLFERNLYPDKLTNQLGRQLKMATFTYEPYSIVGKTTNNHHGSEMVSAINFALNHNMTPVPVVNEEDYWGDIFNNWTGNGLLGNLVDDKADIGFCIAALYTWEYCYYFLDLSKPLVRTGITCLVPAPKFAARWLIPLLSYSLEMWICVIVTFTLGITILSSMLFFYNHNNVTKFEFCKCIQSNYFRTATTIVIKPALLQSLTKTEIPVEPSAKFMVALMLILSLILTSTYSSGLSTVMTLPRYENSIDTVEDFARSGLDWGATQDAWIVSIQDAEEPTYKAIVSKFHPISEEYLREYSKSGKWAFSIERLPFNNFAIGSYIQEDVISDFRLMVQDLYWEQCVIMLRKNSILLPALDLFVLKIFEGGLISFWQNQAVAMFMDVNVQRAVSYYTHHHQPEHEVVKIKWSHVEGPFAILALGYCLSFIVFVIEIIVHRRKQ